MTHQADKFFANQYVKMQGKAPGANAPLQLPEFPPRAASLMDDFHSALEPSDSNTD